MFVCLFVAILFAYFQSGYLNSVKISFLALIFWGVMSGLLIVFFDVIRPRLAWFEFLGKISFSLYLVHFFIGSLTARWGGIWQKIAHIFNPDMAFAIFFLFNALLSIGIALLMYKYIEQPGMRYGSSFIKRRYG